MAQDCTPSDVAYSHGRGWWVCWFELRDARRASSARRAEPVPNGRRCRPMETGEPKKRIKTVPVEEPVPTTLPI